MEIDEDENNFPLERLTSLLGTEHSQHFPALIHLAVADLAYTNTVEDTDTTTVEDTDTMMMEECV